MSWAVNWDSDAIATLATIWMQSADRKSVTSAGAMIDRLLATDPIAKGSPLSEGLHFIEVHPLRALFEVFPVARSVRVVSVGELL